MSDEWVEVPGSGTPGSRKYYYSRFSQQVRWDMPHGVRILWCMERDLEGQVYYWNKDSHETVWSLPGTGQGNGSGGWDGAKGGGGSNAAQAASSEGGDRATRRRRRKGGDKGGAAPPSHSEPLRRFLEHAGSQVGLWDCAEEASEWLVGPEGNTLEADALLECSSPVSPEDLFPSDRYRVFSTATAPAISPGYLAVGASATLEEAVGTVERLGRCWWTLALSSPRLATIILVTTSGSRDEASCADMHRELTLQAPAPLVVAVLLSEDEREARAKDWSGGKAAGRRRGGSGAAAATDDWSQEWWTEEQGEETEEDLAYSVADYLSEGPREVQELALHFASRFNAAVRNNPNTPYSADKKNDGSFKKWIISLGYEVSAVFDRNKSMVSLPENHKKRPAASAAEVGPFKPAHGVGTEEARQMEQEVLTHLRGNGATDMGALRQVNDLGVRFNMCFFHKPKVNDGSWKKWLASLRDVEVATDPRVASYHGNQPTVVRLKASVKGSKA